MNHPVLRIARPTNILKEIAKMYCKGLNLEILAHFENHDGFDGIMVGTKKSPYHFEFTQEANHQAPRSPSKDFLIVFYIPNLNDWNITVKNMESAGFTPVNAHNPYWDQCARTFEDPEGHRVVISKQDWTK